MEVRDEAQEQNFELGDGLRARNYGGGNADFRADKAVVEVVIDNQIPGQIPGEKPGKYPEQYRPNARTNTRRRVDQIPGPKADEINDLSAQMPEVETVSGAEIFDQSGGLEELWRIEKDGPNRYRWRLKFTTARASRPGGKITSAVRRRLKRRPGKGRHRASRELANRLRDRAIHLAEQLRKVSELRTKSPGRGADDHRRAIARTDDSTAQREQLPELQNLDTWGQMPDLLM